jgi:hypothetical protein
MRFAFPLSISFRLPDLATACSAVLAVSAGATQAPCGSIEVASVAPTDPEVVIASGHAVAMSGDGNTIALGSFSHAHGGVDSGAAWVIRNPGTPAQTQAELIPSAAQSKMYFGHSLSMDADGDVLVVGSPMYPNYSTPTCPSSVYVYRFDGAEWNEEYRTNSYPGHSALGNSVAVSASGDVFVSGAPRRGWSPFGWDGVACVYRHGPSGWCLEAELLPAEAVYASSAVGAWVAISPDGNFVAMNGLLGASGTVYVFGYNGTNWNELARLKEPVAYSTGGFGTSIGLSAMAETVVVGNFQDGRVAYMQGAVTVFRRNGATWPYEATLLPSVLGTWGQNLLGRSVRIDASGDRVFAGEVQGPNAGIDFCGAVSEYQRTPAGWTLAARHAAPIPEQGAQFGRAVACSLSGKRSTFSEPLRDHVSVDSGIVHVFEAPCLAPQPYCTAQSNTLGCAAQIGSTGTPSLSASSGFTIAAANVRNQQNAMLFYGTSGRSALPWKGGTLCVQPPLRRLHVVNSGGAPHPALDCSGQLACDFNAWCSTSSDPHLFAGQRVRAQYYVRDPGAPFSVNLTDALEFYLEP